MKRRAFTKSLLAVMAMPALPTTSLASSTSIPPAAEFWAKYFAGLPGHSPVRGLQIALKVSEVQARSMSKQLVAQGILQSTTPDPSRALSRGKSRFDRFQTPQLQFNQQQDIGLPPGLNSLRDPVQCRWCLHREPAKYFENDSQLGD